ncbi:MAG: hypothetical protein E7440_07950 [Ruminococcaceae bacterium]|nr:hypothetical protein [Oscillospiraceae bacterium]
MRKLKQIAACALTAAALLCGSMPASAAESNVSYSGDAGHFVFAPGSDQSVTDLFTGFKDVMPGDILEQTVTVRNHASDKVSVKLYLRALGAHEQSQEFLSQLTLVVNAKDGELFHAPANQTAQLDDWVELGEFCSGGETDLNITLQVPTELDNRFMDAVGYLDWQFMVEEFPVEQPDDPNQPDDPDKPIDPDQPDDPDKPDKPIEPDKPDVPKTGDNVNVRLFTGLFVGSGLLFVVLLWLLLKKREKKSDE